MVDKLLITKCSNFDVILDETWAHLSESLEEGGDGAGLGPQHVLARVFHHPERRRSLSPTPTRGRNDLPKEMKIGWAFSSGLMMKSDRCDVDNMPPPLHT